MEKSLREQYDEYCKATWDTDLAAMSFEEWRERQEGKEARYYNELKRQALEGMDRDAKEKALAEHYDKYRKDNLEMGLPVATFDEWKERWEKAHTAAIEAFEKTHKEFTYPPIPTMQPPTLTGLNWRAQRYPAQWDLKPTELGLQALGITHGEAAKEAALEELRAQRDQLEKEIRERIENISPLRHILNPAEGVPIDRQYIFNQEIGGEDDKNIELSDIRVKTVRFSNVDGQVSASLEIEGKKASNEWSEEGPQGETVAYFKRLVAQAALGPEPKQPTVSPYTALMAFSSWLTTRPGTLTVGATHEAGIMAELVSQYAKAQGWSDAGFDKEIGLIKPVPEEKDAD